MELLKRQLLCPRYIQHSARVLFEAIFDLSREEIVKRVQAGSLSKIALGGRDYVYDVFPGVEGGS